MAIFGVGLIAPEILEPICRQFGVAGGMLNVAVSQIMLDRPRFLPVDRRIDPRLRKELRALYLPVTVPRLTSMLINLSLEPEALAEYLRAQRQ